DIPLELDGFEVVALNVTKLRADNIDPRLYLDRLEAWKTVVEAGGGTWRVINDLDRLEKLLGR
ncbi:MAG: VWA domain-containing protein, partial [Proteobacteria bacterium]|nr:VWA domain-containing protein [Pseudomonadota bacterium]